MAGQADGRGAVVLRAADGRGEGSGLLPSPVAKQWEKVPEGRMRVSSNGWDSRREALIRPVGHLLPSLRDGRRGWGERPRLFRHSGLRWDDGIVRAFPARRVGEGLRPAVIEWKTV